MSCLCVRSKKNVTPEGVDTTVTVQTSMDLMEELGGGGGPDKTGAISLANMPESMQRMLEKAILVYRPPAGTAGAASINAPNEKLPTAPLLEIREETKERTKTGLVHMYLDIADEKTPIMESLDFCVDLPKLFASGTNKDRNRLCKTLANMIESKNNESFDTTDDANLRNGGLQPNPTEANCGTKYDLDSFRKLFTADILVKLFSDSCDDAPDSFQYVHNTDEGRRNFDHAIQLLDLLLGVDFLTLDIQKTFPKTVEEHGGKITKKEAGAGTGGEGERRSMNSSKVDVNSNSRASRTKTGGVFGILGRASQKLGKSGQTDNVNANIRSVGEEPAPLSKTDEANLAAARDRKNYVIDDDVMHFFFMSLLGQGNLCICQYLVSHYGHDPNHRLSAYMFEGSAVGDSNRAELNDAPDAIVDVDPDNYTPPWDIKPRYTLISRFDPKDNFGRYIVPGITPLAQAIRYRRLDTAKWLLWHQKQNPKELFGEQNYSLFGWLYCREYPCYEALDMILGDKDLKRQLCFGVHDPKHGGNVLHEIARRGYASKVAPRHIACLAKDLHVSLMERDVRGRTAPDAHLQYLASIGREIVGKQDTIQKQSSQAFSIDKQSSMKSQKSVVKSLVDTDIGFPLVSGPRGFPGSFPCYTVVSGKDHIPGDYSIARDHMLSSASSALLNGDAYTHQGQGGAATGSTNAASTNVEDEAAAKQSETANIPKGTVDAVNGYYGKFVRELPEGKAETLKIKSAQDLEKCMGCFLHYVDASNGLVGNLGSASNAAAEEQSLSLSSAGKAIVDRTRTVTDTPEEKLIDYTWSGFSELNPGGCVLLYLEKATEADWENLCTQLQNLRKLIQSLNNRRRSARSLRFRVFIFYDDLSVLYTSKEVAWSWVYTMKVLNETTSSICMTKTDNESLTRCKLALGGAFANLEKIVSGSEWSVTDTMLSPDVQIFDPGYCHVTELVGKFLSIEWTPEPAWKDTILGVMKPTSDNEKNIHHVMCDLTKSLIKQKKFLRVLRMPFLNSDAGLAKPLEELFRSVLQVISMDTGAGKQQSTPEGISKQDSVLSLATLETKYLSDNLLELPSEELIKSVFENFHAGAKASSKTSTTPKSPDAPKGDTNIDASIDKIKTTTYESEAELILASGKNIESGIDLEVQFDSDKSPGRVETQGTMKIDRSHSIQSEDGEVGLGATGGKGLKIRTSEGLDGKKPQQTPVAGTSSTTPTPKPGLKSSCFDGSFTYEVLQAAVRLVNRAKLALNDKNTPGGGGGSFGGQNLNTNATSIDSSNKIGSVTSAPIHNLNWLVPKMSHQAVISLYEFRCLLQYTRYNMESEVRDVKMLLRKVPISTGATVEEFVAKFIKSSSGNVGSMLIFLDKITPVRMFEDILIKNRSSYSSPPNIKRSKEQIVQTYKDISPFLVTLIMVLEAATTGIDVGTDKMVSMRLTQYPPTQFHVECNRFIRSWREEYWEMLEDALVPQHTYRVYKIGKDVENLGCSFTDDGIVTEVETDSWSSEQDISAGDEIVSINKKLFSSLSPPERVDCLMKRPNSIRLKRKIHYRDPDTVIPF